MSNRRRRLFLAQTPSDDGDETDALVETPRVRAKPRARKAPSSAAFRHPIPKESWGSRGLRMIFRPRILLLAAVSVSAFVFAPRLRDLAPDLAERREYQIPAGAIETTEPPRWVPEGFVERVVERAGLPAMLSVLDDSLTEQVAAAFAGDPWVAGVVCVRKQVPARVTVELEFRYPVAMVAVQNGLYPVDPTGILLPPADFSLTEARTFPVIQNVQSLPRGSAGTPWGDVAVAAAARLAHILQSTGTDQESNWQRFRLAAIRIPDRTRAEITIDDVTLELLTHGGSRIVWGRPPASTHPGELTAEQKVGRLEKYHSDFGGFDGPHGPYEIDIRHWQEISRRPLTMRQRGPRS